MIVTLTIFSVFSLTCTSIFRWLSGKRRFGARIPIGLIILTVATGFEFSKVMHREIPKEKKTDPKPKRLKKVNLEKVDVKEGSKCQFGEDLEF